MSHRGSDGEQSPSDNARDDVKFVAWTIVVLVFGIVLVLFL